jgi:hypothetical protein
MHGHMNVKYKFRRFVWNYCSRLSGKYVLCPNTIQLYSNVHAVVCRGIIRIQQAGVEGHMSIGGHIPTKAGCYVARTELLSILLSCYLVFTCVYLLTVRVDVTVEFDHTQS